MPFCVLAIVTILAIVACKASASGSRRAWARLDSKPSKIHEELALHALTNRTTGRYFDTLLHIVDVYRQVGPGTKYRIQFMTARTKCPVSQIKFSKRRCPPKKKSADNLCIAVVHLTPGAAARRIESFLCKH